MERFDTSVQPRIITDINQLVLPQHSSTGFPSDPLIIKKNVWIEIDDGRIGHISAENEPVPSHFRSSETFNARGRTATPGFVDCHTHPVFAQSRQCEFVQRCLGKTYQEISAAGGGILSTVKGVRNSTESELTGLVRKRLDHFLTLGTTTIEAKSGYGLSLVDELKSLQALKAASEGHAIEISPTLLAAHTVPPEFQGRPDRYIDIVCEEIIPQAAAQNLAESVDVFLEKGAFNLEQARRVFEAGRNAGLGLRIHADQFTSSGGAELAVEFDAISADHMDHTDIRGQKALAAAFVPVVLLPGAVFFLGLDHYAPARGFIDHGCRIALSTDFNPGSSPTQSMTMMMTLACIKMHLTPAEALWAATMGGANALGRTDYIGTLTPGYSADICLWDVPDVDFIPYQYGDVRPDAVFKKGTLVHSSG